MYPEWWRYIHVYNPELADEAFVALSACAQRFHLLAVDCETTGLQPKEADLVLLTIATPDTAYVFDPRFVTTPIKRLLSDGKRAAKLVHSAPFDWGFIAHHLQTEMRSMYDTRRAQQAIGRKGTESSLARSVKQWLGFDLDKTLQTNFVGKSPPYAVTEEVLRYAAADTLVLFPLYYVMADTGLIRYPEFLIHPSDIGMMHAYVYNDAPWPNTREYPSLIGGIVS